MSTGAWLLVALAAVFSPEFSFHPYLAYPTAAIALAFLHRRIHVAARLLALLVAALCGVRASGALNEFGAERYRVRQSLGASARCAGEGTVAQSPNLRDGSFVAVIDATRLDCDGFPIAVRRLRLHGIGAALSRGDRVEFVAQLGPVSSAHNIDLMNPLPRLAAQGVVASGGVLTLTRLAPGIGILAAVDRARNAVRERILTTYAPKARGLARALVLGENDLEPDEQLAFQRSGLSHLLAVSGTHLVLAVVSVVRGAHALLVRFPRISARYDVGRIVAPLGIVLAVAYADFAGGSGSAWRAAWMLAAMYLASVFDRRLSGLRALALSILVGVAREPLALYDVSFALSALATSGLIVLGPHLRRPARKIAWRPLAWVSTALGITCSAMVPCTPLLLLLSPEVTLVGLAANVVAGPCGELAALPLCLVHTLAAPVPWLERGLAVAGSGALLAVGWIAKTASAVSWARVALPPPTVEQFALLLLAVLIWISLPDARTTPTSDGDRRRFSRLFLVGGAVVGWLLLEWAAQISGAPKRQLRVTAIDVGQGDALLVDLPDGRSMLVDGGGAVTGGPDPGTRI
ncbi:MAG: ComEC/Rec2 family competence protein, partial [Myxococcales bacterium]